MKVIFRKFRDGDVVALLPEVEANRGNVMSYMHVGQHSEASVFIVDDTRPAQPSEYAPLLRELQSIYDNALVVAKRLCCRDLDKAWGWA